MDDNNINISLSGSGVTLVGVLFIALKLLDKIDWSWWWVLAPFWISAIIVLIILAVVLILLLKERSNYG